MAISLSRFKQAGAKQTIAKKLAKEYKKQQSRARKRKGWSGLLGKIGGTALGALGVGLAGVSGGLLAPLVAAAGQQFGKKLAHEATGRGVFGRGLMGADTSKISGQDKYGYGKESAKSLRSMLESEMAVDPFKERGGFGKDILSSYLSAGLSGKLGGVKTLLKGGKGSLGRALTGTAAGKDWAWGGWSGAKEELGKAFDTTFKSKDTPSGVEQDVLTGGTPIDYSGESLETMLDDSIDQEGWSNLFPESQSSFEVPDAASVINAPKFNIQEVKRQSPNWNSPESKALRERLGYEQGGYIPKYYGGGEVEGGSPTISDYFDQRGVSLGGSNKQSLAEMLGRK